MERCTKSQDVSLDRRPRVGLRISALSIVLACALATAHGQSGFPFGRELIMDVAPMKGSKRVPILDIADNGLADIVLWCAEAKARLIVVANTITVLIGPKTERACAPEQARRDEETLAALSQATNWRLEEDMLVLSGGAEELRFRLQTN